MQVYFYINDDYNIYYQEENTRVESPDMVGIEASSIEDARRLRSTYNRCTIERCGETEGLPHFGKYYPLERTQGSISDNQVINTTGFACPGCARAHSTCSRFLGVLGEGATIPQSYLELFQGGIGLFRTLKTTSIDNQKACAKCGFLGHNSRTCETTKFYDKVGVEIEGRWHSDNADATRDTARGFSAEIGSDGSIRLSPIDSGRHHSWEIRTKPGTLAMAQRQVSGMYPDSVDYSCGMHVHVSFKDITHISQLTCPEFYEYFLARWKAWGESRSLHPSHHFWTRLAGRNDYCRQNQFVANNGREIDPFNERYQHLNFSSWTGHRTLECRMLPLFQRAEDALSAMQELISIYQDYLAGEMAPAIQADASAESFDETQLTFSESLDVDGHILPVADSQCDYINIIDIGPAPQGTLRLWSNQPSNYTVTDLMSRQAA